MPGSSNGIPMVSRPLGVAPGTGAGEGFGPVPPEPPHAARVATASPASATAASRRTMFAISVPFGRLGRVKIVRVDVGPVGRPVVRPDRLDPPVGVGYDRGLHELPAQRE